MIDQVVRTQVTAGSYRWTVRLAPCYYQVDFVRGPVLARLGPAGSSHFYGARTIATVNGGQACRPQPLPSRPTLPTPSTLPSGPAATPSQSATPTVPSFPPDSISYPLPAVAVSGAGTGSSGTGSSGTGPSGTGPSGASAPRLANTRPTGDDHTGLLAGVGGGVAMVGFGYPIVRRRRRMR
jgi:hypothetical protein